MALVDVFEDVLDSLDRANGFNIDVAALLVDEICAVGDNPLIIDLLSPDLMCLASVTTSC